MRLTKKTNIKNEFNCNYLESEEINLINEESPGKAVAILLNKLGQLEDVEEKLGIDLIVYIKLVQEGFYGFCEDEDHDKPYIFNFLPRDFVAYSDELVVYWEDSDKVYKTYKYKDYGKTWALTEEELK